MFEQSDEALIKKALAGHKRAWLKLVTRYEKPIFNYAYRMVSNQDDAKDLMQEIFISVFRNLSSYRGEGSFKGWIFRIANYRCIEFYRRKKPQQGLDDTPELENDNPGFCPEEVTQLAQQGGHLVKAMAQLPVNQKVVVELKFFENFTFDEIADQLGISSNTAKSRMYSALAKLKTLLEVQHV